MKQLKRLSALLLALFVLVTVCACHKKDEVAITINGQEFTSADYLYYLINADMEAMEKVQADLTEEEQADEDLDIYSKKIEKKTFENWTKDTALDNLKKAAAYFLLCKENDIKLDEETESSLDSNVNLLWDSYGYGTLFEPNGVSKETYKRCFQYSSYQTEYFDHIYGAEGTKAISEESLRTELYENFLLADKLDVTFSEETDEEKEEIKAKLDGYVEALQSGSMTFEQAYHDYNGEEETQEETADSEEEKPLDSHAQLIASGDLDEDYSSYFSTDYYDTVKNMAIGEVKLEEKEDGAGYVLLVKKNLEEDDYYLKNNDSVLRHLIADEELEKEIDEYVKKLDITINQGAIDRFKVKDIQMPSAS